jgi:outer membrane protein OmpA-like peptidoglycan-associated protein
MTRLWPWSSGAPTEDEQHNELEKKMSPDVQFETDAYDLKPRAYQATAGQAQQAQAGAQQQSLQQS